MNNANTLDWSKDDLAAFSTIIIARNLVSKSKDQVMTGKIDAGRQKIFDELQAKGLKVFIPEPVVDTNGMPDPKASRIIIRLQDVDRAYKAYQSLPLELPPFRFWPTNFIRYDEWLAYHASVLAVAGKMLKAA